MSFPHTQKNNTKLTVTYFPEMSPLCFLVLLYYLVYILAYHLTVKIGSKTQFFHEPTGSNQIKEKKERK